MSSESQFMQFVDTYSGKTDAKNFINDRILAANNLILVAQQQLATATAGFQSVFEGMANANESGIAEWNVELPEFDKGVLLDEQPPEPIDLSDMPSMDIDLTPMNVDEWNIGNIGTLPQKPSLRPVDTGALSSLNTPSSSVIGTPPSCQIIFTPEAYVSGLADFLQGKIRESIEAIDLLGSVDVESNVDLNGNTSGIPIVDTAIEQAIYDRANSRIDTEELKAVQEAQQVIQARGFPLPPGALSGMLAMIGKTFAIAREDLANDITKNSIELEQKRTEYELQKAGVITDAQYKYDSIIAQLEQINLEYLKATASNKAIYIDSGTKLEGILASIHDNMEKLRLEVEKETVAAAISCYNLRVETYGKLMEAYKVEVEATVETIKAEIAYNQGLIDVYSKEVQATLSAVEVEKVKVEGKKVNADVEKAKLDGDIAVLKAENERFIAIANEYETEVKAYGERIGALKVAETLDLERYQIEARGKGEEIAATVQKAVAEMDLAMKTAGLQIEALKSQTTLSANIISSALNSINTQASFGYSGSARRSFQGSDGERKSLSFNYSGETDDNNP